MTLYRTCPRCQGSGDEPDILNTACAQCRGRARIPGRPDHWPPVGSTLESAETIETFEVLAGEAYEMVEARSSFGEVIRIKPAHIGPEGLYRLASDTAG